MRFNFYAAQRMKSNNKYDEYNLRLLISAQIRDEEEERIRNTLELRIEEAVQKYLQRL